MNPNEQNVPSTQPDQPGMPQQPQSAPQQQPESLTPAVVPQPQQYSAPATQPMPQPQMQPQAPMNASPMQQQPTFSGPSAQPPAGGSGRGKLIAIIASAVGGVVLLVVLIVIFVLMSRVSVANYSDAYETASDARSAYSEMSGSFYVGSSLTETERENELDSLKKSREKFNASIAELKEDKAIQRDSEAQTKYDALVEKKKSFDTALDSIIEIYEEIIPATNVYNSRYSISSDREPPVAKALKAFQAVDSSTLRNANNKDFVNKMVANLKKLQSAAAAYDKSTSSYKNYDPSAYTRYSNANEDVSNTLKDWRSNMLKASEDAEISDEFNELGYYLADKASGK